MTLRREIQSSGRRIEDGHLQLTSGKSIEQIVIEEETPGVVVAVDDAALRISFEAGSALDFSLRTGKPQPLRIEPGGEFADPPDPFPGQGSRQQAKRRQPVELFGGYFLDIAPDDNGVLFRELRRIRG